MWSTMVVSERWGPPEASCTRSFQKQSLSQQYLIQKTTNGVKLWSFVFDGCLMPVLAAFAILQLANQVYMMRNSHTYLRRNWGRHLLTCRLQQGRGKRTGGQFENMDLVKDGDGFLTWENVDVAQSEDWDTVCHFAILNTVLQVEIQPLQLWNVMLFLPRK